MLRMVNYYYQVFDKRGLVRFQINDEGYISAYRYNAQGLVETESYYYRPYTGDKGAATEALLDSFTQATTSDLDRHTHHQYDGRGLLLNTRDAENHTESFTYDSRGNRITHTNPRFIITLCYDAL